MPNKSKNRSSKGRVSQQKSKGSKNPPQLRTNFVSSHTFRYVTSSGGADISISNGDLLDIMCLATASTAAYRVLDGVKLKSVEIWSANGSGNVSNTCTLEWIPTNYAGSSSETHTDTALGLSNIAHVYSKTPKNSAASLWVSGNPSSSYYLFKMTLPEGSIVDITALVSFRENDLAASVLGSVSGATAGTFYYRYLDSTGSKLLAPLGAYAI